jgi:hypothetical protein
MSPTCTACLDSGDCPKCHGVAIIRGDDGSWEPCRFCHGTGECPKCVKDVDLELNDFYALPR